jgi:hypothetical protein
VFTINRLPPATPHAFSPFEILFKQKPDYTFFHVLDCACYPLLRPYAQNKLQIRSEKCVFLGYSQLHKCYYCLHLPTQRVYVSRHVLFDESDFPFASVTHLDYDTETSIPVSVPLPVLPSPSPCSHPPSHVPTSSTISHLSPEHSFLPSHSLEDPGVFQNAPSSFSSQHHMLTRQKTNTLWPKFFPDHQIYNTNTSSSVPHQEPTCFTHATKSKE